MGIWDKGKVLNAGEVLTDLYGEGEPFVLFAMANAGEADLGNGLPPAQKTVLLCQRVESKTPKGGGPAELVLMDEVKIAGAFSQPIGAMQAEAEESDFPVVVCWRKVTTKSDREATVLDLVQDRGVPTLAESDYPQQWGMYV